MYYAGLDIHKAFTLGVIKDEKGNDMKKEKFENTEADFVEFFKEFPTGETQVVIESTCLWEHIYDKLIKMGYKVKLSNPVQTKAIAWARKKTDTVDASTLADLLRTNFVPESYIPSEEMRRLRDVIRQRRSLVKGRTQTKNRIQAVLTRHGIKMPYRTLCNGAINWIKQNYVDFKDVLQSYFNILEAQDKEVEFIEERIEKISDENKQAVLLKTIPGIGPIRAMEIVAEIADISRFSEAAHLCSYAGLVPSIRQSGNSLRFGRLVQQASKTLKCTMIEVAWVAVSTKEANSIKNYYKALLAKGKIKQKAICATARKMLCIVHAMLRKGEEFRA